MESPRGEEESFWAEWVSFRCWLSTEWAGQCSLPGHCWWTLLRVLAALFVCLAVWAHGICFCSWTGNILNRRLESSK